MALPATNSPLDRAIEVAPGLEGALRAGQLLWTLDAIDHQDSFWPAVARDLQESQACARRAGRNPSFGNISTLGELLGVCRVLQVLGTRVPGLDETALRALSEFLDDRDWTGNRDRLIRYIVNTAVAKGWGTTVRHMSRLDALAMLQVEMYWDMLERTVEKMAPWYADVARITSHWLSSQRLDELLWAAFRLERLIGEFSREQVGAHTRIRRRAPLFRPFETRDGKIIVRAISPGAPALQGLRRDLRLAWDRLGFETLYVELCSLNGENKTVAAFSLGMDGRFRWTTRRPLEPDAVVVAALGELSGRLDNGNLEFNAATRHAFADQALVMAHADFLRREGLATFMPGFEREVLEILPGHGSLRKRIANATRRAAH